MKYGWAEIYAEHGTIDISPLINDKAAVICSTNEQAAHLVSVIKMEYPEINAAYDFPYTGWSANENTGYDIYEDSLIRGSVDYYSSNGIKMIPFEDLVIMCEEEIAESEISIMDFIK